MSSLNVEEILTGTPEKAFLAARRELMDDYNETSANEFFYTYCEQPLSFILRHSREIFSETYFGYDFYLDLIDHYTYDPRTYATEAVKVRDYLDLAKKSNMSPEQIEKYDLLLERLIQYDATYSNFVKAITIAASSENGEDFFSTVFDYLYDIDQIKKNGDPEDLLHRMDYTAEIIFGMQNVYCKIIAGLIFCERNPSYLPYLIEASRSIMHNTETDEGLANIQRMQDCVRLLVKDDAVLDGLRRLGRPATGIIEHWVKIASNEDMALTIAAKKADEGVKEIADDLSNEKTPYAIDIPFDVAEAVGSDEFKDRVCCEKYDNYSRLHAIYEAKMEAASVEEPIILENAFDILCGVDAELSYLEWEDDGSPNAVIQRHIMTSKEKAELAARQESEKNTLQKIVAASNMETEKAISSESELCNKIKAEISRIGNIDTAGNEDQVKDEIRAARSNLNLFRKEATSNNYNRAVNLCNDLEEEIKVSDPLYESYTNSVDKNLAMFLEDSPEEDEATTQTPSEAKKPKTDVATKIQNKALDRAAKDEAKLAKQKETTQKLKNAANAVSSTPKRVGDDLKKFVSDFDKWDDNRRKEFLLKPGYRHKIMKHMKNAIMLGSVASMNLALIPFAALVKHASTLKDKRIRNELAKELESEIHICEEKINDANSAGDNKSKYELMRIKDKLEAEKVRVRINSNYM